MIGDAAAAEALVLYAQNKELSDALRIGAIDGLSYTSLAKSYREIFFTIMADSDNTPELRGAAARALGRSIN